MGSDPHGTSICPVHRDEIERCVARQRLDTGQGEPMKGRKLEMPITGRLLASIIGVAACSLMATRPALPEEGAPDTSVSKPPAEKPAAVPEGASGLTIHIDPQTGVIR